MPSRTKPPETLPRGSSLEPRLANPATVLQWPQEMEQRYGYKRIPNSTERVELEPDARYDTL